jgi:uncharacterized repeat protein (TIGR03803 family)
VRRIKGWKTQCAVLVMCAATSMSLAAQTFTGLYGFKGPDGSHPYAGLVQGPDGNLYGTTSDGGVNGSGNVFRITPAGTLTSLYDFCAQPNCTDGQFPDSTLVMGPDGDFYGTTQNGGIYNLNYGTIFKISPTGVFTTLHSFNVLDGVNPYGALLLASDGNLYGTTNQGGTCTSGGGCGTVFSITPSGTFTTLYNFCLQVGCPDGEFPVGGLIEGSDGNLYGTTNAGGRLVCAGGGCGTIFRITKSGALTTLHFFRNTDGAYPAPALIEGRRGVFYGSTVAGGANGDGTVFAMTWGGKVTTLYSFNSTDGRSPFVLTAGSDRNFYATTSGGGPQNHGTIFEITPTGTLTPLHSFGETYFYYFGAMTQHTNGRFYGTTYFGGPINDGTIYNLSVGLKAFVKVQPSTGQVGGAVSILGSNLSRTTSVLFNGIPATFQIVSDTLITATVPAGASSGQVKVMGSQSGLKSNVPFLVTP